MTSAEYQTILSRIDAIRKDVEEIKRRLDPPSYDSADELRKFYEADRNRREDKYPEKLPRTRI